MNRLFRDRQLPGVKIDSDATSAKHDSIAVREAKSGWQVGNRRCFITARRLEAWLISDWQHKQRQMSLPDLDFSPVRSGLFYSLRLGGTWVAADWWLHYFALDQQMNALRLEALHDDLNRLLLPLLPEGTAPFESPPRENVRPANQNDKPIFSPADLKRIAAANPRWNAWQQQVYDEGIAP